MPSKERLEQNIAGIRERIEKAAVRSGRPPSEINLVAVTKTVSTETIRLLPELGILDIGENRVQSALQKAEALPTVFRWHMIGHLQRNKVKKALALFKMVHSLDSLRLAQALEREEEAAVKDIEILVQVNVSGEETKYGIPAGEAEHFFETLAPIEKIRITGLMTMAPFVDNPEEIRYCFKELRLLRDQLKQRFSKRWSLPYLSMGMTQDFEVAIEEGANIIRVGTELFRGVEEVF